MAATNLEEGIASLEEEMRAVKSLLKTVRDTQQPWWERHAGMFRDNPVFDAIVEAGQAYRRSLASHTPECSS
jgi:hypothetical protein